MTPEQAGPQTTLLVVDQETYDFITLRIAGVWGFGESPMYTFEDLLRFAVQKAGQRAAKQFVRSRLGMRPLPA
jgi:hypothetical protein